MSRKQTLAVGGMTCTGCEDRIEKALDSVTGVESVTADHESGIVAVVIDDALVSGPDVRSTIEKLGYSVGV